MATGGVEILDVPGDHDAMLREPHVEALAEKLRGCLEEAGGAAWAARGWAEKA